MALDRNTVMQNAEKFLRAGRLDAAIAEYVRLVDEQPRDWNAVNTLGDLYARAGDSDRAVQQFTRIADHLFVEGFLPKAAALYKKALKTKSTHEHTLMRLGEIAAQQGLTADAKMYLRQLARQRRDRGDHRGAAECLVRLGTLDEADVESRLAGAHAAVVLEEKATAASLFKAAASALQKQERQAEALDALVEAAALDPEDARLRRRLARECLAAGQIDRARSFLTAETAGDEPELLLALGRLELAAGRETEASAAFSRFAAIAPSRAVELVQVAEALAAQGQADAAFGCVDIVADAMLLGGDYVGAIDALRAFLRHGTHAAALRRLLEVAREAGMSDLVRDTTEALRAFDPRQDPPAAADVAEEQVPVAGAPAADVPAAPEPEEALVLETLEIDRNEALAALSKSALGDASDPRPTSVQPDSTCREEAQPPRDLEAVFGDMRARVEEQTTGAAAQYERALQYLKEGRIADAVADLQAAARTPTLRFTAAARLGRLHLAAGEREAAVEWLERAAEAPAPSPEEALAVLYDLADALDRMGESARALAVLMELDAFASGYRDVRDRIEQLARDRAGSPQA